MEKVSEDDDDGGLEGTSAVWIRMSIQTAKHTWITNSVIGFLLSHTVGLLPSRIPP